MSKLICTNCGEYPGNFVEEYIAETRACHRQAEDALHAEIERLTAQNAELLKALRPFSKYIDKSTCKITMVWEEVDYISTYSDTLKPGDFEAAFAAFSKVKGGDT